MFGNQLSVASLSNARRRPTRRRTDSGAEGGGGTQGPAPAFGLGEYIRRTPEPSDSRASMRPAVTQIPGSVDERPDTNANSVHLVLGQLAPEIPRVQDVQSGWQAIESLIGILDGPSDLARHHDSYLYGTGHGSNHR